MTGRMRVGVVVVAGLLGLAAQAAAQVTGMPLFTNPRFGTGLRVHADIGQPTDQGTQPGNLTVMQGGVTLALWRLGIGANVGALKNDIKGITGCTSSTLTGCNPQTKITGSALAQLRLVGGGINPLALSVFGGASLDVKALDVAAMSTSIPQIIRDSMGAKELTIPVGASIGLHIPLVLLSVNLWAAPRYNIHKFIKCPASVSLMCHGSTSSFRWAAGADIPLFGILGVRAAYDSGKINGRTVNYWGVGASVGLGGMR